MTYSVWGQRFDAGELTGTALSQPFTPKKDMIIKAIRTQIIVFNNPVFTNLIGQIYSTRNSIPQKLLHTSTNTLTKSAIHTLDNAVKEIFFQFNDPSFNANTEFAFVINGAGYAPTSSAYLSWKKGFPDPVNATGVTVDPIKIVEIPFTIGFIAHELS